MFSLFTTPHGLIVLAIQAALCLYAFVQHQSAEAFVVGLRREVESFKAHLREESLQPWIERVRVLCGESPGSVLSERFIVLSGAFRYGAVPHDQGALDDALADRAEEAVAPLRRVASIAVLVGLAGTLFGLAQGVANLRPPKAADKQSLDLFFEQMREVLSGFGGAFGSALVGVLVAVLATLASARLDALASRAVADVRTFARDVLLPTAARATEAGNLVGALGGLTAALAGTSTSLPAAMEGATRSIAALEGASETMARASENFSRDLNSSGVLSESLARLEKILLDAGAENRRSVQKIEETVEGTMNAIVEMQTRQIELAEALARMVVERPMEVAASRLLVGDREEFRRLRTLVESIDTKSRHISSRLDQEPSPSGRSFKHWIKSRLPGGS